MELQFLDLSYGVVSVHQLSICLHCATRDLFDFSVQCSSTDYNLLAYWLSFGCLVHLIFNVFRILWFDSMIMDSDTITQTCICVDDRI